MKTMNFLKAPKVLGAALALGLALAGVQSAQAQVAVIARDTSNPYQKDPNTHVRRVLYYSYKLGGHNQTYLENALRRLARIYGFQLDIGSTATYITETSLGLTGADTVNPVNVAVFNNGDGDVLSNATALAAMKKFVQEKGRGLLQIHAAAAYVPCPTSGAENLTDANCRWLARVLVRQYLNHNPDPNYARIYVDSVKQGEIPPRATGSGAVAAGWDHGKNVPEFKTLFDSLPSNNGVIGGPDKHVWDSLGDEWYNYRGYVRQQGAQTLDGVAFGPVIALLSMDESAPYTASSYRMGDRVQAWARHVGNGLTIYYDAGHGTTAYTGTRRVKGVVVNDTINQKINWRFMRYLARDFVGCMDSNYVEYNRSAAVTVLTPGIDDPTPCKTPKGTPITEWISAEKKIGIVRGPGAFQVQVDLPGSYQVSVLDASGRTVHSATAAGPGRTKLPEMKSGSYMIRVTSGKQVWTKSYSF
jgi:hypothetical protein